MKREIERLITFIKALEQTQYCLSKDSNTIGYSRESHTCYLTGSHDGSLRAEMDSDNNVTIYDYRILTTKRGGFIDVEWFVSEEFKFKDEVKHEC